ncbi:MAG: ADP-ribosylglycohydrolase family protein [Kiritimatiellae bacterium]|nr:ADP-ribosylglycohydrolase family protein [Kiritimatiellia bacterium]
MNAKDYRKKVSACWLGKAVGGTLGQPHEGKQGPLGLTFYDPVPKGLIPNDDLDLQVLWAERLRAGGVSRFGTALLADAWDHHVVFPWDEYGVCKRNIHYGLRGAALGAFDNWFADGMGAIIRSELWACLAPGDPERAAAFAWHDAVLDHCGDGVWAEVLFAALEALAFVESDRDRLLDAGLALLPGDSSVRRAVADTRRWWAESGDWEAVRRKIRTAYGTINFTYVAENLAYIVLGWLAGGGDFGKAICAAANCGADVDCTAATLGALLAIINPDGIGAEWQAPVSGELVLSPGVVGIVPPCDLDAFTEWTVRLCAEMRQTAPRMGEVCPQRPPAPEDSPVQLPVRVGWESDRAVLERAAPPEVNGTARARRPGHWLRLHAAEFEKPVRVERFVLHMPVQRPALVMSWVSNAEAAVWLDGKHAAVQGVEWGLSDRGAPRSTPVPSFHRAGPFVQRTDPLAAGDHDLTVALTPRDGARPVDLVLGVGNTETKLWEPWALARTAE